MNFAHISYLRVSAMLMVVLFHCLCYYTPTFGNFGWNAPQIPAYIYLSQIMDALDMPIFVYVSGYLFSSFYFRYDKYKDTRCFLKGKVKRLLIPYLFFGLAVFFMESGRYSYKSFIAGISHLWFLLMLFGIFVIFIFIKDYIRKSTMTQDVLLVTLLFASYYLFSFFPLSSYYFTWPKQVFRFLPCFMISFIVVKYSIDEKLQIYYKYIWSLLLLSLILFFPSLFLYKSLSIVIRLLGIIIAICICLLSKYYISSSSRFIQSIDDSSMGIYLIHHLILGVLLSFDCFRDVLNVHSTIAPFLVFVILLLSSFFITEALKSNKFTKIIVG